MIEASKLLYKGPLYSYNDRVFFAAYGNHGGVKVRVEDKDAAAPEIKVDTYDYAFSTSFTLNLTTGQLNIVHKKASDIISSETRTPADDTFAATINEMLGYVSYAMASASYRWPALGTNGYIIPELTNLTNYLVSILTQYHRAESNCILYEEPGFHGEKWETIVGITSNLDKWNNRAHSAWVRNGYQLILFAQPDFQVNSSLGFTGEPDLLILSGAGTDEHPAAEGSFYNLQEKHFDKHSSSLVCVKKLW
jgi:hypothetical protein